MKRQKVLEGTIVKIDLGNGFHSYARILKEPSCAFYGIKTKEELSVENIIDKPVLFIVAVFEEVIKSGEWQIIATLPLEDNLKELPMKFIQDDFDYDDISLFNPNSGEIIPSTKDECQGLERSSVWDKEHIIDRINDHFSGKKNKWVEHFKIK